MNDPSDPPRAVLLDALGTLVELDDPVGRLGAALAARGIVADAQLVGSALRKEIAFYRAEHHTAVDAPTLAQLRAACAVVFGQALGAPARSAGPQVLLAALLEGLRFRVFADVAPALARWRAGGVRLAVVSNWDVSLHEVLDQTGLAPSFDVVLTSAQERIAKPDPEIFARALQRLGGIAPGQALYIGDDLDADVRGAEAAGVGAVLLVRDGLLPDVAGVRSARTLAEIGGPDRRADP